MQNYKGLTVDLSNCDKEPIHIIGRTQHHGFLMVINQSSLTIEQVSENISQYLHVDPTAILNNSLKNLLAQKEYTSLEKKFSMQQLSPCIVNFKAGRFFGFIHQSEDKIILECEPYRKTSGRATIHYNALLADLQAKFDNEQTLEGLSGLVVDFMQTLLDYDRVLIFQFDAQWNAKVIAEKVKPGIHSFTGHYFPASDIPAPARVLLEKKHIRHIPDVLAASVAIIPYLNPSTGTPTNILESELRNPSEIHLEYLTNMHVKASLSFSVIVKGKLWGLISCSNESPQYTDVWTRQLGDIVAKTYANGILASEEKRDLQQFAHYKRLEASLIEAITKSGSIRQGFLNHQSILLEITQSSGAALLLDDEMISLGETPTEIEIREIIEWFYDNSTNALFHTNELSQHLPGAIQYPDKASGLLALEISRYAKEYLLFFKPQVKATRIWAGNPDKPPLGADLRLHPRKSFDKWKEEVKGKSAPWTLNEQEISQILVKDLIAFRLGNQAFKFEELNQKLRRKAEELKTKNTELEDFVAIITHNLRSPMNSISALYTIYQKDPTMRNGNFVMEHIKTVSDNMLATIADLNLILKTKIDHQLPQASVNIAEIIEKEKQNLETLIIQTGADITMELAVPNFTIPNVYMESIIHNLLSNALKYRSPKRKPSITVKSYLVKDQFYLSISDNGLGMDLKRVGHKLFGLYKTFHENKDSKGLGLYLTKMQVEALGGRIEVVSEPDQGTTFTIIFNNVQG